MVGKGTASASVTECAAGTVVTLTQKAEDKWQFKGWSSDQVTVQNDSFVMPVGDVTIEALFEEAPAQDYNWLWILLLIILLIIIIVIIAKRMNDKKNE